MKKIEFVNISSQLVGFGLGKGSRYRFEGVENVIKSRIEDGWEYSGYVPLETRATGDIETMTLIFQKEE